MFLWFFFRVGFVSWTSFLSDFLDRKFLFLTTYLVPYYNKFLRNYYVFGTAFKLNNFVQRKQNV